MQETENHAADLADGTKNEPFDGVPWAYCLVGNIVDEHEFGEDKEIRRGTKHFAPGAKVYCLYRLGWGGMGYESMVVMGKPRKQGRLIKITVRTKYIRNFRLKKITNRKVMEAMSGYYNAEKAEETRAEILRFAEWFNGM